MMATTRVAVAVQLQNHRKDSIRRSFDLLFGLGLGILMEAVKGVTGTPKVWRQSHPYLQWRGPIIG